MLQLVTTTNYLCSLESKLYEITRPLWLSASLRQRVILSIVGNATEIHIIKPLRTIEFSSMGAGEESASIQMSCVQNCLIILVLQSLPLSNKEIQTHSVNKH